jgi:hypothetical protein
MLQYRMGPTVTLPKGMQNPPLLLPPHPPFLLPHPMVADGGRWWPMVAVGS